MAIGFFRFKCCSRIATCIQVGCCKAGYSESKAAEKIFPDKISGQRVKAPRIPLHGSEELIAINQDRDKPGSVWCLP